MRLTSVDVEPLYPTNTPQHQSTHRHHEAANHQLSHHSGLFTVDAQGRRGDTTYLLPGSQGLY